ncbi:hypothetical protein VB618_07325 [Microvirga sp. CF3062]|uniref:hypothetical protein n=1 Tax=Microvirga sp. CF3062 TaxID=3110182 RepID=UPI002E786E9A|nr:hypothetical protein [Microvirga sp. CF3062]MEE1656002.1 hypothetical protein [Microvirga sp. CF3062]
MSDEPGSVAVRLWRDRAQLREEERNEAQARLRIAHEKVAILMAENERLETENARLRALQAPDESVAQVETDLQMEALKGALQSLIAQPVNRLNA